MATISSTPNSSTLLESSVPERRLKHLVAATRRKGLVVIAGPTGSGKEEFAAELLVRAFPSNQVRAIALVSPGTDIPVQKLKDAGVTVVSMGEPRSSLFQAVRSAPDALLVDDVRDGATLPEAANVASMGHTVFVVLHSDSEFECAADWLKHLGTDWLQAPRLTIVTLERQSQGAGALTVGFFTAAATLFRPFLTGHAAGAIKRAHPNTILWPKHPSFNLMDGEKCVGSPADVLKSFVAPEAVADGIAVDHSDPAFQRQVSELLELGWSLEAIRGILAIHGYVWNFETGEEKLRRHAKRRRSAKRAGSASKKTTTRRRGKIRRRKQAAVRRR